MARRKPKSEAGAVPLPSKDQPYEIPQPFWGPNVYVGVPAVIAFWAMSLIANMPEWLFWAWNAFLVLIAYLCLMRRHVRLLPLERRVEVRRYFGFVPAGRSAYPFDAFGAIRVTGASIGFVAEQDTEVVSVALEWPDGRTVPLKTWASGKWPEPGPERFVEEVAHLTGLRVAYG